MLRKVSYMANRETFASRGRFSTYPHFRDWIKPRRGDKIRPNAFDVDAISEAGLERAAGQ